MRCPYCRNLLQANSPECPACRLSYPRAQTLLGAVPRLSPMVADTGRMLRATETAKLRRRIEGIHARFPQLVLQVVLHRFPAEHPFGLYAFWLFNAAALAGDSRRGRENHALMLVIDPDRAESAIIPGYGLEPFLADEALDHLLEMAGPAWAAGRWADGVMRVLDGLDSWLETIAIPEQKNLVQGEY